VVLTSSEITTLTPTITPSGFLLCALSTSSLSLSQLVGFLNLNVSGFCVFMILYEISGFFLTFEQPMASWMSSRTASNSRLRSIDTWCSVSFLQTSGIVHIISKCFVRLKCNKRMFLLTGHFDNQGGWFLGQWATALHLGEWGHRLVKDGHIRHRFNVRKEFGIRVSMGSLRSCMRRSTFWEYLHLGRLLDTSSAA
jgi:hypothetical protein